MISFGYRCSTGGLIQKLNLKTESHPFDWCVSKLDVIKDCIETKFIHFSNVSNYEIRYLENYNLIDGQKISIDGPSAIPVNTYYETTDNVQTYNSKLALNHQNLTNDYDYYQRCIHRLYDFI
jgi:hypothetical protein